MEENIPLSNIWTDKDAVIKFTWYPGADISQYNPFIQVYAVCFNKKGDILIQKYKDSNWCLPGGTVEDGETSIETMRRELIEETDVTFKNPILLGAQFVQYLKGHNTNKRSKFGDEYYQLRYYCEVDKVLPQTPDPDKGEIRDRLFVKPEDITKYFDWGNISQAIISQATEIYRKKHDH